MRKPELWTFPRCGRCAVDCVWWQLLEHDPTCHPAHTWGLCWQGTALWPVGAQGGQGGPRWPTVLQQVLVKEQDSKKVTAIFAHELCHSCFVVQVPGSGMLAAWELLPRVYGQQQLQCAAVTSFKSYRQGSTHRALMWLEWSLAVTHCLQGTTSAQAQPSQEQTVPPQLGMPFQTAAPPPKCLWPWQQI